MFEILEHQLKSVRIDSQISFASIPVLHQWKLPRNQ